MSLLDQLPKTTKRKPIPQLPHVIEQTVDLTPITQRLDTIEKALGAILSHLETDMELQGMEKEVMGLLKKSMEKGK